MLQVTRSKKGKAIYSPLHRFVNKEKFSVDRDSANEDLVQHAFVKSKHFFKSGLNQASHFFRPNFKDDGNTSNRFLCSALLNKLFVFILHKKEQCLWVLDQTQKFFHLSLEATLPQKDSKKLSTLIQCKLLAESSDSILSLLVNCVDVKDRCRCFCLQTN